MTPPRFQNGDRVRFTWAGGDYDGPATIIKTAEHGVIGIRIKTDGWNRAIVAITETLRPMAEGDPK